MNNKIILWIGLLSGMFFTGCEKDKGVNTSTNYTQWQKLEEYVCLNSYADDNQIYIMTYNEMMVMKRGGIHNGLFYYVFPPLSNVKFPIRSKYFCYADNNRVCIQSTTNSSNYVILDFKSLVEDFVSVCLPRYSDSEAIAINENNVMLIPYTTTSDSLRPKLMLCKIAFTNNDLSIGWTKTIATDELTGYREIYRSFTPYTNKYLTAIDDKFFVTFTISDFSDTENSFLVYEDGVYSKLDFPILKIFSFSDTLVALDNKSDMRQSFTRGVTWGNVITNTNLRIAYYDFQTLQIDNRTVGFGYGGLAELSFRDKGIIRRDLAAEPIIDFATPNKITSVSALGDSVFATSHSGYYYKPREKFFESNY